MSDWESMDVIKNERLRTLEAKWKKFEKYKNQLFSPREPERRRWI